MGREDRHKNAANMRVSTVPLVHGVCSTSHQKEQHGSRSQSRTPRPYFASALGQSRRQCRNESLRACRRRSTVCSAAALDAVCFTFIVDDIVFPDGRTLMGVLGGGGDFPQVIGLLILSISNPTRESGLRDTCVPASCYRERPADSRFVCRAPDNLRPPPASIIAERGTRFSGCPHSDPLPTTLARSQEKS